MKCSQCDKEYPQYVLSPRTTRRLKDSRPLCPFCLPEALGRYLTSEDFDLQHPANQLIIVGTFIGSSNRHRVPVYRVWTNNGVCDLYDYDEHDHMCSSMQAARRFVDRHDVRDGAVIRVQLGDGTIQLLHFVSEMLTPIGQARSSND